MAEIEEKKQQSASDEVVWIAGQAEDTFRCKGCRWETYFFKVVLAGNVKVIRQVVAHLEQTGSTQTLDWLFQRNKFEEICHTEKPRSKKLMMMRGAVFVLLNLVSVLLTPVFYALHILSATFLNRKQKRISADVKLPLAYAVFSQSKEMITLFMSQGVDINHIDQRGNNVFHYIADLSSMAPGNASHMFCSIIKEINNLESVKKLLEQNRNSSGLTAVEYAAKFGSPSLLAKILEQPNLMHPHTSFSASEDYVTFNDDDDETGCIEAAGSTRVELVDVSMYEAGTIMDQSTLLNILSDRDVAGMSSSDLQIFAPGQFIGQWLLLKSKQMLSGVMLFQIFDLIITCMMVYILSTSFVGLTGTAFMSWRTEVYRQVQMKELEALSKNTSSIVKPDAFHKHLNKERLNLQKRWLEQMWVEDLDSVQELINLTSLEYIIFNTTGPHWTEIGTPQFDLLGDSDMDAIYEQARKRPEFASKMTFINIVRQLPVIVTQFAHEIYARRLELMEGLEHIYSEGSREQLHAIYDNFTVTNGNDVLQPRLILPLYNVTNMFCPDLSGFRREDFKQVVPDDAFTFHTYSDLQKYRSSTCQFQVFINIAVADDTACDDTDHGTLLKIVLNLPHHSNFIATIRMIIVICTFMYIILDLIERCVFLTKSVVYQWNPWDMLITALGQKVPGSYMRKQLNVLSCLVFLVMYHYSAGIQTHHSHQVQTLEGYYTNLSYVGMMFIVAIVVRFLMHIHSLRLMPGIGHFIITTFMMGTNLLHFSAVFGFVVLIFAMLFHILIDDPNCPLEKSESFVTVIDSIFATFKLTFGHGEMEEYFTSAPVKLTYVLYVIIVCLLLLNLIIAIMSTTAEEIMAEPWKEVLWKVEWLDEATSVENTVSVITLPFRRLRGIGYKLHKKAGFIVKKISDSQYKIYIECFHCPALQVQLEE